MKQYALTGILFFGIIALGTSVYTSSSSSYLLGTFGTRHTWWTFVSSGSGNAGIVTFERDTASDNARVEWNQLLGKFYIETIWWAKFRSEDSVTIVPPESWAVQTYWTLSGTAYSENAGVIKLDGVRYNPVDKKLIGHGWNRGIGKIPFSLQTGGGDGTDDGVQAGFVGRVKIIWQAGGENSFFAVTDIKTEATGVQTRDFTSIINQIRNNIAPLMRNIGANINTDTSTAQVSDGRIIYTLKGTTIQYSEVLKHTLNEKITSVIILGGNFLIDEDIVRDRQDLPLAFIVLRNEQGQWGNIIISKKVKKIYASLISDGPLWSGDGLSRLYNTDKKSVSALPSNQLYIYGSVISRNTIGWAAQEWTPVCPYSTNSPCTHESALRYDLNYFRGIDEKELRKNGEKRSETTRWYPTDEYDTYAVVIEYNPKILQNPPPGMAQ